MKVAPKGQRIGCRVCDSLPPGDLIELDLLMGDASRWPKTVWGIFEPPRGVLPPSYQRFGAIATGMDFLRSRGHTAITKAQLRTHYRYDVVVVPNDPVELVARGLIEDDAGRRIVPTPATLDPIAYLTYFNKGIALGNRALELLERRVDEQVRKGEPIPIATLQKLAELGAKLATTQASLRARYPGVDEADEDEGFRAGSQPLPSPRMGHHRIRVIDGEARPVADEGPADRAHYNARAAQEGGPQLPTR